jgi:hypothetical protein
MAMPTNLAWINQGALRGAVASEAGFEEAVEAGVEGVTEPSLSPLG